MYEDLLRDLDAFFCKTYADYDRIASMPSYQAVSVSRVPEAGGKGRSGADLLDEARKLCYQPQADAVLAELKECMADDSFSFSFRVAPLLRRIGAFFSARRAPGRLLSVLVQKYGGDAVQAPARLGVAQEIWQGMCRGRLIPEKGLLFKAILLYGFSREDAVVLMRACSAYYDHTRVRDVVVQYLVQYRILNEQMIARAFEEYRLRPL